MSNIKYILPLALLASGAVNAADDTAAKNGNPWYVGARFGGTYSSDFSDKAISPPVDLDRTDIGGGVFLGYNINRWVGIETGYTHLGDVGFSESASVEQQGIDLVGKFNLYANDSLQLFAKAGVFYYATDGQDQLSAYDDNGMTATAGLGMEYFFNKNVSARLEYQYYNNIELQDAPIDTNWDTQFYGLSLVYAWGAAPMVLPEEPAIVQPKAVMEKPVVVAKPQVKVTATVIEIAPLTIELPFEFDSGKLPQKYLDQLAPIAQHLIDYPDAQLFVVGHTDSRGSEVYNQKLSEQRAALIADYLATKFAIDKSRINQSGRGELQPRASNKNAEGQTLNRRVSVFTPGLKIESK
jgi:OOP family OmpA-OmpF porin